MIQVWGLLSTEASFLAAMNATDSEKAELLRIQDIMERDPFEPNKMGNLDHRLHGAIAKISRNSALYDYVCDIQSHLGSLAFATQFNERRYVNSVMEHKNMVDAIVNGHAELARAYTQIHFQLSAAFHRGNVQEFNQRLSGKKGP
nr:FCD domain-containing protein [Anaerotruncus rubiinfantis]